MLTSAVTSERCAASGAHVGNSIAAFGRGGAVIGGLRGAGFLRGILLLGVGGRTRHCHVGAAAGVPLSEESQRSLCAPRDDYGRVTSAQSKRADGP